MPSSPLSFFPFPSFHHQRAGIGRPTLSDEHGAVLPPRFECSLHTVTHAVAIKWVILALPHNHLQTHFRITTFSDDIITPCPTSLHLSDNANPFTVFCDGLQQQPLPKLVSMSSCQLMCDRVQDLIKAPQVSFVTLAPILRTQVSITLHSHHVSITTIIFSLRLVPSATAGDSCSQIVDLTRIAACTTIPQPKLHTSVNRSYLKLGAVLE